jgi:hypothetical protein
MSAVSAITHRRDVSTADTQLDGKELPANGILTEFSDFNFNLTYNYVLADLMRQYCLSSARRI